MDVKELEERILKAYPDAQLVVYDSNGRGDHFDVRISSDELNKLSRIQKHQAILKLFDEEFKTGALHALSVKPI